MDINTILRSAILNNLNFFLALIVFIVVVNLLRTPMVKGLIGEAIIKVLAKLKLPKAIYVPIHNVTLPTSDGTTQIDHIFVSKFGVFVVETKNMKGWIFGSEKQAQWTQQIYKVKNRFQNPLHQNYKHVKTLESALDIPADSIKSVIAFTGSGTIKTEMPKNVTHGIGYVRYIKSFTDPILTDNQVLQIVEKIRTGRLEPSRATNKEHIQNLENRKNLNTKKACPKCGKPMVLRTAKKGETRGNQFWGCSGFPTCRTVQAIT